MAWQRTAWIIGGLAVVAGAVALLSPPPPAPTPSTAPSVEASVSTTGGYAAGTPAGLLAGYVEGDFQGERLERASWPAKYHRLVEWPAEPAWQTAYVIRAYRLQSNAMSAQIANVDCTYDTLGELNLETFTYESSPSRQTVAFKLQKSGTAGNWRVGYPMLKPHVGVPAAIAYLKRMAVGYPQRRGAIAAAIATLEKQLAALPVAGASR